MSPSSILASPVTFHHSGKVAPNRFLKSAMTERLCEYSQEEHEKRGKPTDEYVELYRQWGLGEIGVIVLGNIPVDRTLLEAKGNAIIDKRSASAWDPVEAFKGVISVSKANGMLCIGQLTAGGRQTSEDINPNPVSSSDVQCPPMGGMTFAKPRPMTIPEIEDLVDSFAYAAKVLYDAGADGAQLHGAHGYLLSQFLSARVNKRTDKYGGPLENRSRIVFEIIDAIKARVPKSFLLSMKLNSADFAEGGFNEDESGKVCRMLEEAGVDLIELSGGSYESLAFEHKKESTKKRESYFIEFADEIRPTLKTAALCVTGGFRSKSAMEEAVNGKSCDFIGLARPLTAEPQLCRDILNGSVTESRENKVPNALQTGSSIAQLGAIAKKQPIPDLADEKVAQDVVDALMGKKEKPKEDHNTSSYEKGDEKESDS